MTEGRTFLGVSRTSAKHSIGLLLLVMLFLRNLKYYMMYTLHSVFILDLLHESLHAAVPLLDGNEVVDLIGGQVLGIYLALVLAKSKYEI